MRKKLETGGKTPAPGTEEKGAGKVRRVVCQELHSFLNSSGGSL